MLSGDIARAVTVEGTNITVTKGAKAAIEAAGGKVVANNDQPAKAKPASKKAASKAAEEQPEAVAQADASNEESNSDAE
jgi:hypothetical protein